jgi:hypothetical protein
MTNSEFEFWKQAYCAMLANGGRLIHDWQTIAAVPGVAASLADASLDEMRKRRAEVK